METSLLEELTLSMENPYMNLISNSMDQVDTTLGSELIIDTEFNDSNEWNISNVGGTTGWVVSNGQAIMNTDNVSTGRNLLADNSNNLTLGHSR